MMQSSNSVEDFLFLPVWLNKRLATLKWLLLGSGIALNAQNTFISLSSQSSGGGGRLVRVRISLPDGRGTTTPESQSERRMQALLNHN